MINGAQSDKGTKPSLRGLDPVICCLVLWVTAKVSEFQCACCVPLWCPDGNKSAQCFQASYELHSYMSEPLDSRQLRAFATLARTGSFTLTARELRLSQSAISHSMKALEQEVRCRLLDRMGKTVVLTQAGEQLLAHAERILGEMAAAREQLGELGKWGHGRLRICTSTTACQYILPAILRKFKESFPQYVIQIEPGDTPAAMDLLRRNQIDL